DGSATWTRLETGTEATLMAGVELGGGRVVIAGLAGAVLRSEDGGRSFRGEALEDRRGRVAMVALERSLLLLGEGGSSRLEVAP
ncbi:MAG: sialidase, partial [Thermoanaerobaculia bacterium]|nr:sialidase [Thermoanaerobaculia bacterium]